jgi:hypothetical protein
VGTGTKHVHPHIMLINIPVYHIQTKSLSAWQEALKFSSWWNETKYNPNSPWGISFQNCVYLPLQLSKMAATADYATFGFPAISKFLMHGVI